MTLGGRRGARLQYPFMGTGGRRTGVHIPGEHVVANSFQEWLQQGENLGRQHGHVARRNITHGGIQGGSVGERSGAGRDRTTDDKMIVVRLDESRRAIRFLRAHSGRFFLRQSR